MRGGGEAAPGNGRTPRPMELEDKFLMSGTHSLNEPKLGEYCRSKGIFPAEIEEWREALPDGQPTAISAIVRDAKKKSGREEAQQGIERERCGKRGRGRDSGAADALRKKRRRIWGDGEED